MFYILWSKAGVKLIMDTCWKLGSTMLFLERLSSFFYAYLERPNITPTWVKLLGILVEFWSHEVYK